jgi:hypothetical protein
VGAPQPNAFLDSIDTTGAGMHSGVPPHLLAHNQLSFAVNVTNRGGHPKTRPRYRKLLLQYADDDTRTHATQAIFQGAAFHEGFGNQSNSLVSSIGGRIFRYRVVGNTATVVDLSIAGDLNNPNTEKAWLWQSQDFEIINDGLSFPLFFDGATLRRSAGPAGTELPAGTVGQYINGRTIMALPDRRSYIASDLVYNTGSGTPSYQYRDSILKMTDNVAILGGASFGIPVTAGKINAIFAVAIPDTSLGQGPIQIGTRKGIFSATLPLDATQWTTTAQPTQVVSLPHAGPLSDGVTIINGDAWYRAKDGLRSYQVARRDFNTWVQTPLSFEMEKIISKDTPSLLVDHFSSIDFNNRLLSTVSPYRVPNRGIAHRGLMVIDFNNISSLTTRATPCYDGLWTGIPILQLVNGVFDDDERAFAFALDGNGDICIYEILSDDDLISDFDGTNDVSIESWIISNALFALEGYTPPQVKLPLKKLICADLFIEEISGSVEFEVKFKTDQMQNWHDWKTFSICSDTETCSPAPCTTPRTLQPSYSTFKRLPEPQDDCNPVSKRLYRTGYQVQLREQWTGKAQMRKTLVWATPIPETLPSCPTDEPCIAVQACGEEYFSYHIE